ncbi:hypothetical protein E2562_026711, partial [Oryza meyeriana var. granulata]
PTSSADGSTLNTYHVLLAALRRRLPPSASAIVLRPTTGSHLLGIDGYTNTKSIIGTGESITSRKFDVGGRKWFMKYYPNGYDDDCADSISVYVDVAAGYDRRVAGHVRLSLLDHAGKPVSSPYDHSTEEPEIIDFKAHMCGERSLIKREELERSEHLLKDDCFTVRCDLTVIDEQVLTVDLNHQAVLAPAAAAVVPPSDLHRHLSELLLSKEGADVDIQLGDSDGETFHAHRWVLAARSPVLKAELSALPTPAALRLAAMDTEAFKALLHFIYTDTLPDTKKQEDEDTMAGQLLAAADMYKMERLKLICEDKLRKRIGMGNVAITLALAEQHHCRVLKDACLEFLASPGNLKAAMATDGFEHLKATAPSVLMELVMKQLA